MDSTIQWMTFLLVILSTLCRAQDPLFLKYDHITSDPRKIGKIVPIHRKKLVHYQYAQRPVIRYRWKPIHQQKQPKTVNRQKSTNQVKLGSRVTQRLYE
jgi:hypothetical protein